MNTVKFFTLGCKANQYDTQSIREKFLQSGYKEIDNGSCANIYVINTCTVTCRADRESLNLIRRSIRENPKARLMVTGCLTELNPELIRKISRKIKIIKNSDKHKIAEKGISYFKGHTRAFLKIQDGCNNFCSYCKVPLVRGPSRSKPLKEVIREAKALVKSGYKEIVLTGICLGAYGRDLPSGMSLVEVITVLQELSGLLRIRLSSIEIGDLSFALIDKIAHSKKLCRHLHIPLQSGDDEILKKMHRKYCREDFLSLIRRIKSVIAGIAITTDVLVGFPGESELNFQHTMDLIKQIQPLKVHIFPYSRREGTAAAENAKEEIDPRVIKKRILHLQDISLACADSFKKRFLNKVMPVLIEGRAKENPDFWVGYTDNYLKVKIPIVSGEDLKNQLVGVRLTRV